MTVFLVSKLKVVALIQMSYKCITILQVVALNTLCTRKMEAIM